MSSADYEAAVSLIREFRANGGTLLGAGKEARDLLGRHVDARELRDMMRSSWSDNRGDLWHLPKSDESASVRDST